MRKALPAFCAVLGMLASIVLASPASATGRLEVPGPPPSDRIVIDLVTVNGSGCPLGTAAVAVAPDNTAFTVTYSDYLAQVGVGSTTTDWRKNCQLNILVHVPQGFTYAVSKVDYRGFASLQRGSSAIQRANYYFQGQSQTVYSSHSFQGPFSDDWQTEDSVDVAALVWAPCGVQRNLNINTELRALKGWSNTSNTTSFITMDSTDGSINTVYHFSWMHCY